MATDRGKINQKELTLLKQKNKLVDELIVKEKKGGLAAIEAGKKRRKLLDEILELEKKHATVREEVKKVTEKGNKAYEKGKQFIEDANKAGKQTQIGARNLFNQHTALNNILGTELDYGTDLSSILLDQIDNTNALNESQLAIGTAAFQAVDFSGQEKKLAEERIKLTTGQHSLSEDGLKLALEEQQIAENRLATQKKISKSQDLQNDATTKLGEGMKGIKDQAAGFEAQLRAIAKNPAVALGAALFLAGKYLYDMFKGAMALKTELGISDKAAAGLQMQITDTAMAFKMAGVEAGDVKDAALGLMDNFGGINAITPELLSGMAKMKAELGVSGTNAANLMVAMKATGAGSAEAAFHMAEAVGHLAQAEGVAPGQVMQDLAQNTEAFASFAKDGGMNVAMAAIQAKKLGINFDTSVKIADNLLNFEASIQSQMEAEILLGRQLNLDKARQMALTGDMAGLQKEILRNVGTEAEFNQMNVLQRRALAQSIGVSVTELSKMVANQSNLNKRTKSQVATAELMATMMKVIRDLGQDLLGVWQVIKPILMVALVPIGIAVYALVQMLSLLASAITFLNSFYNIGTIILGLLTMWYAVTLLQGAIQAKNLAGRIAITAWTWAGVVATKALAAATWLWNIATGANPIGAIILGVVALIALTVFLWKKFKEGGKWAAGIKIALAIAFFPITLAIGAVMLLYKGFQMVVEKVGGIGQLMKYIGMALLVVMGPVGWFIAAGILIWKNFDKIWGIVKSIGAAVFNFLVAPINFVLDGIKSMVTALGGFKTMAMTALKIAFWPLFLAWEIFQKAKDFFGSFFGGGGDKAAEVSTAASVAQDFISRPGSGIEPFAGSDTVVGVKDEASLGLGGNVASVGGGIDITPITERLGGVIDSIKALEASNKDLMLSLTGKVKGLAEA